MPKVTKKHPNEYFDSLLRRFKRVVDKEDVVKDFRKNEFYEKPSSKRKRAKAAARKRTEKQRLESTIFKTRMY